MKLLDNTGIWRRNDDRSLIRFHFHQRLILSDPITLGDHQAHNLAFFDAFAEIGKFEVHHHFRGSLLVRQQLLVRKRLLHRFDDRVGVR